MTKLEQAARQSFETWWEREGQEFLFALNTTTDDDIKLVAELAWRNGAYCAEQAEQEPVAWRWPTHNGYAYAETHFDDEGGEPLYAAPVRTKDLTDDEIDKVLRAQEGNLNEQWFFNYARAVIAADREKNK